MIVELSEEAQAQVEEIDAWWRENRQMKPELFINEIEWALWALEDPPRLGTKLSLRSTGKL